MPDTTKSEPQLATALKTDRQMSTVRFSPCGKFLAAAGRDATIRLWNVPEPVAAPPADPLAATDKKDAKKNAKPVKPPEPVFPELPVLKGHDGWVTSLEFHPKDQRLYSADSWGQLCAWAYADAPPKPAWQVKPAHDGWIRQLAISSDGTKLATCGMDKRIRLWSSAAGKQLAEFTSAEDVYALAFHPDGKSLVSGDLKGIVRQWDLAAGKPVREFDAKMLYMLSMIQDVGGVRTLAFDAEGKTLAAAGAQPAGGGFVQGTPVLRFFDWASGKATQTLTLGDNTEVYIHELAFHPRGFWIGVVSGQPGKGKFFFLRTGEAQPFFVGNKQMPNCHSVAIHPGGTRLAVISNAGTFGQQKSKAREGIYPGNTSPINIFDLPAAS
jgi:hypothetical protein